MKKQIKATVSMRTLTVHLEPEQLDALFEVIKADELGLPAPKDVLAALSDPENPAHDLIEWDAEKATKQWQLHQADVLIAAAIRLLPPEPFPKIE